MAGETSELKLPFPEEPDNINEGATKIKALAERVDLLLRKQLTKVLEVAKLKVTETVELPKGLALINAESKYSAEVNRTKVECEAGFTLSATRPALLTCATTGILSIGGVTLPELANHGCYWVNPGQVIKCTVSMQISSIVL